MREIPWFICKYNKKSIFYKKTYKNDRKDVMLGIRNFYYNDRFSRGELYLDNNEYGIIIHLSKELYEKLKGGIDEG